MNKKYISGRSDVMIRKLNLKWNWNGKIKWKTELKLKPN